MWKHSINTNYAFNKAKTLEILKYLIETIKFTFVVTSTTLYIEKTTENLAFWLLFLLFLLSLSAVQAYPRKKASLQTDFPQVLSLSCSCNWYKKQILFHQRGQQYAAADGWAGSGAQMGFVHLVAVEMSHVD